MAIKKGDFVALEFEGKIKSTNDVFDKTDKQPKTICVGAGWLLEGIDSALIDKEVWKEFELELVPEKAFGQRNPDLMKLTSISKFKDFRPVPGIQVTVDGVLATVKSVSGGRVVIDFNHHLAGKTLNYKIKIVKKVDDICEKTKAVVTILIPDAEIKTAENVITVKTRNEMPEVLHKELKKSVVKFVTETEKMDFKFEFEKKEEKK